MAEAGGFRKENINGRELRAREVTGAINQFCIEMIRQRPSNRS